MVKINVWLFHVDRNSELQARSLHPKAMHIKNLKKGKINIPIGFHGEEKKGRPQE